jgi:hypothetical protein
MPFGVSGYAYQQVTDDTGGRPAQRALLGGLKGCIFGIGPHK